MHETASKKLMRMRTRVPFELTNSDIRRTCTVIALSGKNHIIMRAHLHAQLCPGRKMCSSVNCSANTLSLSHTPELLESRGALDGWFICSCSRQDIVDRPIGGDRPLLGSSR